eukprot:scaffold27049_cov20-Prasinocladus_malaysianus.AAC.1
MDVSLQRRACYVNSYPALSTCIIAFRCIIPRRTGRPAASPSRVDLPLVSALTLSCPYLVPGTGTSTVWAYPSL